MNDQKSSSRWALFSAGLIVGVTLFRLWYLTHIELVADEAYYWLWSKHLAASYRDKGPIVAWLISLGTWLFGDTVFGIRFFAVILSAATGWQIYRLGSRVADPQTGFWSVVLALIMPMFAVGSLLMTIDVPSLFFWVLGMNIFLTALERDNLWPWIALGFVIGLGFLSKFTNGLQLLCILTFLLSSKTHRHLIRSPKIIALACSFLVAITPLIWWNMQTGWIHAAALHSRSGVQSSFHIRPLELLRFIGGEIFVVSPLIGIGIVIAVWGALRTNRSNTNAQFLLSHILPVFLIFAAFSLNKAGKENWPAPGFLAAIVLSVVYWGTWVVARPHLKYLVNIALGVGLLMTVVLHNTDYLHLPRKLEPLRRAQGWSDFASHVQKARESNKNAVLIANHYSQASMMSFYLPGQPTTYLPDQPYGENQFTLWPQYDPKQYASALFISDRTNAPPTALLKQFPCCKLVDDFWSQHKGRPMSRFVIYLCQSEAQR
ncbi:MAG: ArnT family glycosyltransferase [Limisphaerales bacterium]